MDNSRFQILLVNDDGIRSPGLWAAAEALSTLGYVTVAAPRDQATSMGRAMPVTSDGKLTQVQLKIGEQEWTAYAVGGSPAQAALHGILELMPRRPDLVVSGINYGENVGSGITISGTVMAAAEAAAHGIPALAVSAQLLNSNWYDYADLDFRAAAHFTRLFAGWMLEHPLPPDVHVLKVDVPFGATPETDWRVTRQAMHTYYRPYVLRDGSLEEKGGFGVKIDLRPDEVPQDSDAYTLLFDHMVSVTPVTLDLTSRVDRSEFEKQIRAGG
jgi:5'-nucleotidase